RFPDIRVEAKGRILMMEGMVVPARDQGTDGEGDAVLPRQPAQHAPGEGDEGRAVASENLLLDPGPILQMEHPSRPGIGLELLDALRSVGMHDVGLVEVAGESEASCRSLDPAFEPVDEDEASCRR